MIRLTLTDADACLHLDLLRQGWKLESITRGAVGYMNRYEYGPVCDQFLVEEAVLVWELLGPPVFSTPTKTKIEKFMIRDRDGFVVCHECGGRTFTFRDSKELCIDCEAPLSQPNKGAPQKEEDKMTTKAPTKATTVLTDGAKLAAGLAATEKLNGLCVDLLTKVLVRLGLPEVAMSNDAVQGLIRLVAPLAIAQASTMVPQFQKHDATISKGCTLAFAAELQRFIKPLVAELGPAIESLVDAAKVIDVTPTE